MTSSDKWLSVTEAVSVLGRSQSGIRTLIRTKQIKAVRHAPGGKYQIRESECLRYMAELEQQAA